MPENLLPASEDQFVADMTAKAASPGGIPGGSVLTPRTDAEIARMPPASMDEYRANVEAQRVKELGKQEGVPLQEGLDPWTHSMVQLRRTKEDQVKYLADKFGKQNVRLNELDEPVVRVTDPATQKPTDIVVDPHKLDMNSLITLGTYVPEVVGSILALRFGKGPASSAMGAMKARGGLAGIAGRVGGLLTGEAMVGAAGTEAAGAVKDVGTRVYDRPGDMGLGEIAETRAKNVPVDALITKGTQAVVVPAAKTVGALYDFFRGKGLPNPFASRMSATPELSERGKQGAAYLAKEAGMDPIQFSPGEATGWAALQMQEAMSTARPAGTSTMMKAAARQEDQIAAYQDWMLGALPSDEEAGKRGLQALQKQLAPMEQGVKQGKEEFVREVEQKIMGDMKVTNIPTKGVDKSTAGNILTKGANALREDFFTTNEANYGALFSHPLATQANIAGDLVADPIDKLLAKLPKVEKLVTKPSKLVGPTGQPIPIQVPEETTLERQIKPGLLARLEELSSLRGGNVSLQSLKQIRTDIDDAIKIGEAIPGVKEGFLKQARKAVSDAIETGVDQLNDPNLKALYKTANNYYKANVEKFTQKDIAAFFRDASQTSAVGASEIVDNLRASPDQYKAIAGFFGKGSAELDALHKTVSNLVLQDSLADGVSKAVDGRKLAQNLIKLRAENPDLYRAAYGSRGNELIRQANMLGYGRGNVDLEGVSQLLDPKNPMATSLLALAKQEENLGKQFNNSVLKKFLSGDKSVAELNPDEFVRYLPFTKLSDVQQAMSMVRASDPAAADMLQRKSLQALFMQARRQATTEDASKAILGRPPLIISGRGVVEALQASPDSFQKYQSLLGPDLFKLLQAYTDVELVRERKRLLAAGTGILAKGQAISAFDKAIMPGEKGGSLTKELISLGWDKVIASALANDTLRSWLTSSHAVRDLPGLAKAIVVSEPFIKAAVEELPDNNTLNRFLSTVKEAFGTGEKMGKPDQKPLLPGSEDEFIRQKTGG